MFCNVAGVLKNIPFRGGGLWLRKPTQDHQKDPQKPKGKKGQYKLEFAGDNREDAEPELTWDEIQTEKRKRARKMIRKMWEAMTGELAFQLGTLQRILTDA